MLADASDATHFAMTQVVEMMNGCICCTGARIARRLSTFPSPRCIPVCKPSQRRNQITDINAKQRLRLVSESGSRIHDVVVDRSSRHELHHCDRRTAHAEHGMLLAVRGDLVRVLTKLLKERKAFDGIFIETTGVVPFTSFVQLS